MIYYASNNPPKPERWPQKLNPPRQRHRGGLKEKLTNTSADFTGSRAQHGNIFAPMPGKHALNFELALHTTDATLAPWLMANAYCTVAGAGYVATLATVTTTATKKRTCCTGASCGKIQSKAKAPALDTPLVKRLQPPPTSGDFSRPKFPGMGSPISAWFGGWECLSARTAAWLYPCVYPQPHPLRLDSQRVVLKSRKGAKTMHPVNPLGHSAPTTPTLGKPSTSTTEAQAFALLEATSSASLAAFYLRRGDVKAARRKAVQLLKSLQSLEVASHA